LALLLSIAPIATGSPGELATTSNEPDFDSIVEGDVYEENVVTDAEDSGSTIVDIPSEDRILIELKFDVTNEDISNSFDEAFVSVAGDEIVSGRIGQSGGSTGTGEIEIDSTKEGNVRVDWENEDVSDQTINSLDLVYQELEVNEEYTAEHSAANVQEGFVDLELESGEAEIQWQKNIDGSWETVETEEVTETGEITTDLSEYSDGSDDWRVKVTFEDLADGKIIEEGVRFQSYQPELSNLEPDNELITDSDVILSADVDDKDFDLPQGDEVDVEFYTGDDELIDSETITTNQTVSVTADPKAGENEWYVVATDEYGNEVVSDTKTYQTPENLEIRDETDPESLVTTEADVEVQFFTGDEVITRSTDDGIVNLAGLPADESMTIQVVADGYVTRQSVVESIIDQQNVYLLADDVDSVETNFILDDRTGEFPGDRTRIVVEKPITKDGQTTYQTVVSDEAGVGGYSTVLERDSRYRLSIINEETGQDRVLGPYVTTSSETVNLEVDSVQFDSGDLDIGYEWRADYVNESAPTIRFDFESAEDKTVRDFELVIESRDGDVELINESHSSGDSVSEQITIPEEVDDKDTMTWEVHWSGQIQSDDSDEQETITGGTVVGPDRLPVELPGVSEDVLNVVSVLLILLVAGLFSSANVTVGGIVTSLTAGALWFIGITPDGVTGMFIATGLFISVIAHLRTNQQVRPT